MDRSDAVVVRWTYPDQPDRRLVFEPTSSGAWTRLDQERAPSPEGWRTVGADRVDSIGFEGVPPEYIDGDTVVGP